MAKRTRGSNRPGQRRALPASARSQSRPASRPTSALSADEEARAAELETRIVAQDRAVATARERERQSSRSSDFARTSRQGGQGLLAQRAAEEYAYVARDVRRIVKIGGLVAAVMAVLFVLIDVLRVVSFA
jgi:hypothetical protein